MLSRRSGTKGSRRRRLRVALGLGLVVGAAVLLLPRQLGGSATYVITSGDSMEPGIRAGDLVLARAASSYDLGDVVAFSSDSLGTTVLHRVVDHDGGGRLITQGDNNDWIDPERPTHDDVLGRMWLRLPGAGKAIQVVRHPAAAVALAVALGAVAAARAGSRRRRDAAAEMPAGKARRRPRPPALPAGAASEIASALLVVAIAGAGLAAVAWTRPTTTAVASSAAVSHHGEISYAADIPGSLVYADGRVDTGEPIFLRLVEAIDVTFRYRSSAPSEGTVAIAARMHSSTGWQRVVDLAPPQRFEGDAAEVTAEVDLHGLVALADRIDQEAGLGIGSRSVAFVPSVVLAGVDAPPVALEPEIRFQLDPLAVRLPDAHPEAHGQPILVAGSTTIPRQLTEPGRVVLLGRALDVTTGRGIGTAAALIASAAWALLVTLQRRQAAAAGVDELHTELVRAESVDIGTRPLVEATSLDELERVASNNGDVVVHVAAGDEYYVVSATTAYRYRQHAGAEPADVRRNTVELLHELGPAWTVVENETMRALGVDAVAAGPAAVLAVTTAACATADAPAATLERARRAAAAVNGALAHRGDGSIRVIPAVVEWEPTHAIGPDGATVLGGVVFLDAHRRASWSRHFATPRLAADDVAAALRELGDAEDLVAPACDREHHRSEPLVPTSSSAGGPSR